MLAVYEGIFSGCQVKLVNNAFSSTLKIIWLNRHLHSVLPLLIVAGRFECHIYRMRVSVGWERKINSK